MQHQLSCLPEESLSVLRNARIINNFGTQAHIDNSSAGVILILVRLCGVSIMGDKIAAQPTQQVGAYCIKLFQKCYVCLAQHYGTTIEPVPFNEALHEKNIAKTDSRHQECCVAELPGMLPKITYILLLKLECLATTFEFQPCLEQEGIFGVQPDLVTSEQNKHRTLLPPP